MISGKKFRALRDKKNKYSNSCVVQKKILNETKNHNPPFKLNGRSLRLIKRKGRNCKIFKRDLRRAYRQLVIDPDDIHLMGYKGKGHIYFDRVLTMGLRSAFVMGINEVILEFYMSITSL